MTSKSIDAQRPLIREFEDVVTIHQSVRANLLKTKSKQQNLKNKYTEVPSGDPVPRMWPSTLSQGKSSTQLWAHVTAS